MSIFPQITCANLVLDVVNSAVAIGSAFIYEDTRTSHNLNPLGLNVDTLSDTVPAIVLAVDSIALVLILAKTLRKYRSAETGRDRNLCRIAVVDTTGSIGYQLCCLKVTHDCLTQAAKGGRLIFFDIGGILGLGGIARTFIGLFARMLAESEMNAERMEALFQREGLNEQPLLADNN